MTSKCKSDKYLAFASAAIVCWDTLQIFDTTKIKKKKSRQFWGFPEIQKLVCKTKNRKNKHVHSISISKPLTWPLSSPATLSDTHLALMSCGVQNTRSAALTYLMCWKTGRSTKALEILSLKSLLKCKDLTRSMTSAPPARGSSCSKFDPIRIQ